MGMMNRKVYSKHKPGERVKPVLITGPEGAKQEFREETDINVMMARFKKSGSVPRMNELAPTFADVSNIGSYGDLIRRMGAAEDAFMALDPQLRSRFDNDSIKLVEFLQDESNRPEAVKLGLVPASPAVVPATPALVPATPAVVPASPAVVP